MEFLSIASGIISIILGVVSIVLAFTAMNMSRTAEKNSQENFIKTQEMMNNTYDKTKDVLSEINEKAAVIERSVSDAQKQLMDTMTGVVNSTIPRQKDPGEEMGMALIQALMKKPKDFGDMMTAIKPLMEMKNKQNN